jgi:D-alanyl-D-alanine carboxypeptidase
VTGKAVSRAQVLGIVLASIAFGAVALEAAPVRAEALILVDADSGKVLRAENATYPWYPASTTKLMTLYMTLSAIRDHRITADTLFTVSPNASAQAPVKMGFPIGTQITVDNVIKMMMVKSANDMAVVLAEGVGGSIDDFAQQMTDTAHRLGMTESNFVNPNGLPADGQIMSARDLAILARALIREFPQYSFYWHVPAIKYGRRVVRNYNPLLGRYTGADGMKTGFICASGFNMVATATRDNKQLIAVVLGAPSSSARAVKAAELLEGGFQQKSLSWLTPSLGTVDQLQPMDATPPNLKDEMCGPHRKRAATEEDDPDAIDDNSNNANPNANSNASPSQFSVLLSALRAPTPKNLALLPDAGPVVPTIVYTGPTRSAAQVDALAALPEAADPAPKKAKKKAAKAGAKADTKAASPDKPRPANRPAAIFITRRHRRPLPIRPPARRKRSRSRRLRRSSPSHITYSAMVGLSRPRSHATARRTHSIGGAHLGGT